MSDLSFLRCAECIVDVCGNALPVNDAGCLIVPGSRLVDNGDGTGTWITVSGDGSTFTTQDVLTPLPAGPHSQVLRGDGWADENNGDVWWQSSAATIVDASGAIPETAGPDQRVNIASLTFTNSDAAERIYVAAATIVNQIIPGTFAGDLWSAGNLSVGVDSTIAAATLPGGTAGIQHAGYQRTGFGVATRQQVHTIRAVPPGQTANFTFWGAMNWAAGRPNNWNLNAVNSHVYSVNHTTGNA